MSQLPFKEKQTKLENRLELQRTLEMFAKAVLPVCVSPMVTEFSLAPYFEFLLCQLGMKGL